jgi:hypothetical protein
LDGGAPPWWNQQAGLPGRCGSRAAVRKNRANPAEELGDEDGDMALRLGVVNPLQQRGMNLRRRACRMGGSAWAGARQAKHLSVWMVRCLQ